MTLNDVNNIHFYKPRKDLKILLIKIKNFKIKFQNQGNFYIITLRGNVFYAPLHRIYITDTMIYVYTTIFNGID